MAQQMRGEPSRGAPALGLASDTRGQRAGQRARQRHERAEGRAEGRGQGARQQLVTRYPYRGTREWARRQDLSPSAMITGQSRATFTESTMIK
jgi:hypothetical protein